MKEIIKQNYNISYILTKLSLLTTDKDSYTPEEKMQIQIALDQYHKTMEKLTTEMSAFKHNLASSLQNAEEDKESTENSLFLISLTKTLQFHVADLKSKDEEIPKHLDFFASAVLVKASSKKEALAIANKNVDTNISVASYDISTTTLSDYINEYNHSSDIAGIIADKLNTKDRILHVVYTNEL